MSNDPVNHPDHYTAHPSGVECIQITEHMNFNIGNAVKYLWRADLKNGLEDLKKAEWYVRREIDRRERELPTQPVGESVFPRQQDESMRRLPATICYCGDVQLGKEQHSYIQEYSITHYRDVPCRDVPCK